MKDTYLLSEVESKRFGMNILRCSFDNLDVRKLLHEIVTNLVDVAIIRLPSHNSDQINKLDQLGCSYFQADTLVYYSLELEKHNVTELRNKDLSFVKANLSDKELIQSLVVKIFNNYTNHYYSNPFLNKDDILQGYMEWVINYIEKADKVTFIVKRGDSVVGFATCSMEDKIGEGVLYGVLPEFSGGGVYSDIIRYTISYLKENGMSIMKVSTQVQNYAVQKVWCREGFYLSESYSTIHINSLLKFSTIEENVFDIEFSEEDIDTFGKLSEDFNPIHFNDNFAKSIGFEEKIGHGLIINSMLSKFFGTNFPGSGTIFRNYKYIYFRPLYPNRKYKMTISYPQSNSSKGVYYCLAKVTDTNNEICVLSYNDLVKRTPKIS